MHNAICLTVSHQGTDKMDTLQDCGLLVAEQEGNFLLNWPSLGHTHNHSIVGTEQKFQVAIQSRISFQPFS